MEASVDHIAREASSVRRYPSSLPPRAAWSCLAEGSGLSGMVRSTSHAHRTCRQSEVPAFFDETVQFPGQQGEACLFDQRHFPAASADVAKVYVYGDQGLLVDRRFSHDRPPGINDVRVAPEDQIVLLSDSIDEDNVALEHAGVEAGDPAPVALRVQQLGVRVRAAVCGDYEHLGAVLNRDERQERLPGVVADQHGHAAEPGVEGAHALSRVVVLSLFVDPVVGQVELAVEVPEDPSFEIGCAVVGLEALPLLAKPYDHGHLSRRLGQGADGLAVRLDGDIVAELFQGVTGQTQLREDGEVRAPVPRLRHDLFSLAEILFGIADNGVDLGQCYPHGSSLAFSSICMSFMLWYRNRTTGRTGLSVDRKQESPGSITHSDCTLRRTTIKGPRSLIGPQEETRASRPWSRQAKES